MAGNEVRIKATLDDKVSSHLSKIRDNFDLMGKGAASSTFLGVAGAKALGVGLGLVKDAAGSAVQFIGDSVHAASDFNETLQKSQVVFGDAASGVEQFGKSAALSMGLSANAAVGAAATFGNLFKSLGTAPEKIAPMSEGLVKLASDLASFNNIPVEDALAKLQSGIVGQERPLRALGVAISAASVDVEAANLGFKKINGTFTEGEKVQARYSLIFKQTGTAQGDFARTSGQMANQQRILQAELDNTSEEFGQKLIPVVIQAQRAFIELFDTLGGHQGQTNAIGAAISDQITSGTLAGLKQSRDALKTAIHDLHWSFGGEKEAAALGVQLLKVEAAIYNFSDHVAAHTGDAAAQITGDFDRIGKHAEGAGNSVKLGMQKGILWTGKWRDATISDAQDAIGKAYDPLIETDKLLGENAQIASTKRVLASKTASKQERADASATLHSVEKDQADTLLLLAQAGATGSKAYKDGIANLKKQVKESTGPTHTYLATVLADLLAIEKHKTQTITFKTLGYTGHQQGKAAGGAVSKGDVSWVGERGPELVQFGGNAFLTPADMSRRAVSGGGDTVVHTIINLDGRVLAEIVDKHNATTLQRAVPTQLRV